MNARVSRILRVSALLLAVVATLIGVRLWLEPKDSPAPAVDLSPAARQRLMTNGLRSRIGEEQMLSDLMTADVLLVGEDHFYRETTEYLTRMLDAVEGRRISLLLELPHDIQPAVDEYVATGGSADFERAVADGNALPFGHILDWAHRNRAKISRVVAVDETRRTIFVNRALLKDTRNRTMADAVSRAMDQTNDLVVIYGGQLHMTLGGRYRYDLENRTPAGALLTRELDRRGIRSVLLSGKGKSPASEVLPAGIYAAAAEVGASPYAYFIDYPIFHAATARELFDYFVVLDDLTRIGGR